MSGLTPPFFQERFTTPSGIALSGGQLYFYVAGSTTIPKPVFTDYATLLPLTQPLILDASGTAQQYFMESGLYKIVIKDSTGAVISTRDNIEGAAGSGPVTGDHKVIVSTTDTTPGYLYEKTIAGGAIQLDDVDMGGGNRKLGISINEALLHVPPYGPAGGDLAGFYPDPIVKQLTGLDADMVLKETNFTTTGSPALTGIGAGSIYKGGVQLKAWSAISFDGYIRTTTDDWKTSTLDDSLYLAALGGMQWNALSYVYLAGAYNCNCWVAGDGASRKFFIAKDILANYDSLTGKLLPSAWFTVAYPTSIGANYTPPNVGDIATHGNVMCVIGNYSTVMRTTDMATFTVVCASTYNFGGIATDKYGNWMAIERDGARFWKSTDDGITWALVTSIRVNGVAQTELPTNLNEAWGSLLCSYGTWIAAVYSGYTGHISYAYSTDMLNWTTVTNNNISFFSAASDGIKWYATNPVAGTTPIYQLLISEIPAHKKLVMEQGAVIAGTTILADLKNCPGLATDENGLVIDGGTNPNSYKLLRSVFDTTPGFLANKLGTQKGITNSVINSGGDEAMFIEATGETLVNATDGVYDYLENKIVGDGSTASVILDTATTDHKLVISANIQGTIGSSGYVKTMAIANAISTLAPNLISRSELICLFVPENNFYLDQTSLFGCFLAQTGSGTVRFTLRDSAYRLISYSATVTNPSPSVFLETLAVYIQDPVTYTPVSNYKLVIGDRYYLGINWDANGVQFLGDDAVQNTNIQPYPAYKVDNLSGVPNQLTGGGESKMRLFVRLLTRGTF